MQPVSSPVTVNGRAFGPGLDRQDAALQGAFEELEVKQKICCKVNKLGNAVINNFSVCYSLISFFDNAESIEAHEAQMNDRKRQHRREHFKLSLQGV